MTVFTNTNIKKALLSVAVVLGMSTLMTACSKEHHEVPAVDKVEEAQEIALANAPEPVIVDLPEATAASTDEQATDGTATDEASAEGAEGTATPEDMEKEADAIEEAASLGEPVPSDVVDGGTEEAAQ
ncbi:hypothetical protein [Psychrobacter sp. I-STPA6b]|uniref:hypothetical protein n=1 Tax=Psychrobacter sp. I-STPA6b TaxID=2585718 RepID=UPI001D0C52CF|nr:hypothetical protein [Psychrobacter sp. I-STPA6b]